MKHRRASAVAAAIFGLTAGSEAFSHTTSNLADLVCRFKPGTEHQILKMLQDPSVDPNAIRHGSGTLIPENALVCVPRLPLEFHPEFLTTLLQRTDLEINAVPFLVAWTNRENFPSKLTLEDFKQVAADPRIDLNMGYMKPGTAYHTPLKRALEQEQVELFDLFLSYPQTKVNLTWPIEWSDYLLLHDVIELSLKSPKGLIMLRSLLKRPDLLFAPQPPTQAGFWRVFSYAVRINAPVEVLDTLVGDPRLSFPDEANYALAFVNSDNIEYLLKFPGLDPNFKWKINSSVKVTALEYRYANRQYYPAPQEEILLRLMHDPRVDVNGLPWAVWRGNFNFTIFKALLRHPRRSAAGISEALVDALEAKQHAPLNLEAANLLLDDPRVDPNFVVTNRGNALQYSTSLQLYPDLVQFILSLLADPRVDVNLESSYRQTPLQILLENYGDSSIEDIEAVLDGFLKRPDIKINACYPGNDPNGPSSRHPSPLAMSIGSPRRFPILKKLLEREDIDVNSDQCTWNPPLFLAADNSDIPALELLLRHPRIDTNKKDHDGRTPLYTPVYVANVPVVKTLLDSKRFDLNSKSRFGENILHSLISTWRGPWRAGYSEVLDLLLVAPGLDVCAKDTQGRTPFDLFTHPDIGKRVEERERVKAAMCAKGCCPKNP